MSEIFLSYIKGTDLRFPSVARNARFLRCAWKAWYPYLDGNGFGTRAQHLTPAHFLLPLKLVKLSPTLNTNWLSPSLHDLFLVFWKKGGLMEKTTKQHFISKKKESNSDDLRFCLTTLWHWCHKKRKKQTQQHPLNRPDKRIEGLSF